MQNFAVQASMSAALAATDKYFAYEDVEQSLQAYAKAKLAGADLAFALLEAGFIDENFTLYVTQFPGGASASAMNFIIKAVQRDEADITYKFTGKSTDIETVLNRERRRVLDGESVYNVEIFDHLLEGDSNDLTGPIGRLTRAAENAADQFIAAYLEQGEQRAKFICRLSAVWPDIFSYLRQHPHDTDKENHSRLSSALLGASPDVTYSVSDEDRELIQTEYVNLPAIKDPQPEEQAEKIAEVLYSLGVQLADLSKIAKPLRARIVERDLYPITIANLRTALGPDASLSLDGLKKARPDDVYPYVLAHLDTYLTRSAEAGVPSVADPTSFVDILADLLEDHEAQVGDVASAAASACTINDLNGLPAAVWPALSEKHRFALTDTNLILYIGEHSVDEALASWLGADGRIKVADMTADEAPRVKLAVSLLNASELHVDTKKTTVKSLGLSQDSIDPTALSKPGWSLVPWLVNEGLTTDAADAFAAIAEAEWAVKEERNLSTCLRHRRTGFSEWPPGCRRVC